MTDKLLESPRHELVEYMAPVLAQCDGPMAMLTRPTLIHPLAHAHAYTRTHVQMRSLHVA